MFYCPSVRKLRSDAKTSIQFQDGIKSFGVNEMKLKQFRTVRPNDT